MENVDLEEERKEHYQKLLPLLEKARTAVEDSLESDDDWVRLQAGRFVLKHQEEWLKGATGKDPEKERLCLQPVPSPTLEEEMN